MPCALAAVPRRMLPPPTTRPSCTPRAATVFSSLARRSMISKAGPPPAPRSPANASPESLSKAFAQGRHRLQLVREAVDDLEIEPPARPAVARERLARELEQGARVGEAGPR